MLKQSSVEAVIERVVGKVVNSSSFDQGFFALAERSGELCLLAVTQGECALADRWQIEEPSLPKEGGPAQPGEGFVAADGFRIYTLKMNANNWALVRRYIRWAAPGACGAKGISLGIKTTDQVDRSTILAEFKNRQIKPVLADATPAALQAAGRNFLNLTDDATKAVFAANWRNGYGANAAGLTTEEEIVKALLYGYSMIGFDASDKIVQENIGLDDGELLKKFEAFPEEFQAAVNASYLNVGFQVGKHKLSFTPEEVHRIVLEYGEVIMHVQFIYNSYLKSTPWPIDFELCVRRQGRTLTPREHYFIANELERNGVKLTSFLFDGGDKISDEELQLHAEIANTFEYRLSLDNADRADNDLGDFLKVARNKAHFKVADIAAAKEFLQKI